jgi:hypothetical protein
LSCFNLKITLYSFFFFFFYFILVKGSDRKYKTQKNFYGFIILTSQTGSL